MLTTAAAEPDAELGWADPVWVVVLVWTACWYCSVSTQK
jgi:hypothetical protein